MLGAPSYTIVNHTRTLRHYRLSGLDLMPETSLVVLPHGARRGQIWCA